MNYVVLFKHLFVSTVSLGAILMMMMMMMMINIGAISVNEVISAILIIMMIMINIGTISVNEVISKPNTLSLTVNEQSGDRESVANAYWLISNSKKCPNCRYVVYIKVSLLHTKTIQGKFFLYKVSPLMHG